MEDLKQKEIFYLLRKEIVETSCKTTIQSKVSIRKEVLKNLSEEGFDITKNGIQYLATLITIYFHERKLYETEEIENYEYWNLNNKNNEHFNMLGEPKEKIISEIVSAINSNPFWKPSIDELIYEIADYTIFEYERHEKRKKYQYLLSKSYLNKTVNK